VTSGFHHLAIQVRDLAAVEGFYRDVLGLGVLRRWPAEPPATGERSVWLDAGGGDGGFIALERVAAAAERAPDAPGLHLIALRIAPGEREAWEQRLARAGVAVTHRTAFTLYLRDPEGNRIGLSHWPDGAAG
jgi:glyoxylase I family protein